MLTHKSARNNELWVFFLAMPEENDVVYDVELILTWFPLRRIHTVNIEMEEGKTRIVF